MPLDRERARGVLVESGVLSPDDREDILDALAACVVPEEGIILTRDEAALIVDVLREIPDMDLRMARIRPARQQEIDERRLLAARIEREVSS